MGGGGKSQTSTQQVSIPPEVLARYNAVNARAEDVAKQGFQQYGTTPEAFVAPLTQAQQQGIQQTQQYAQVAQPYFGAATDQLLAAQQQGQAGLAGAYPLMQQGLQAGQQLGGEAYGAYQALPQTFLPAMQQAQQGIQQGLGAGQALLGGGLGYALAGSQGISPQQFSGQAINQYMSPFMGNVVQQTMAAQAQQNAQQRRALTGEAIRAGAFGGDRAGIAQANLAYQQNLANQQTLANLLQGGYGQALGAFQQQQGVNLAAEQANRQALQQTGQSLAGLGQQAFGMGTGAAQQQAGLGQALAGLYGQQAQGLQGLGQQQFGQGLTAAQQQAQLAQQGYGMGTGTAQALAGLGQGAQAAGLQGAQAQLGAGQIQQQTEQAGKQALYNQFLQQQGYPFQVAQFLANIAMGTGALSGSTTTTTQPAPFFSDRKMKEDIRKIGETKDGLPIYKFRYKGEDKEQTHIGYMADEVEKKHPDAVGEYGGAKYVDYGKVNARESMGGAVHEGLGRAAYNPGGLVGGDELSYLRQQIAQQHQMYGGAQSKAGAAGTLPGGTASYVPQTTTPPLKLVTAQSAPRAPQSALGQGMDAYKTVKGLTSDVQEIGRGLSKAKDYVTDKFGSKTAPAAGASAPAKIEPSGANTFRNPEDTEREGNWRGGYSEGGMPYGSESDNPYDAEEQNRIGQSNTKDVLGDVVAAGKQQIRTLSKPGEPPKPVDSGIGDAAKLVGMGKDLAKGAGKLFGEAGPLAGLLGEAGTAAGAAGAGAEAAGLGAAAAGAAEGAGLLGTLGAGAAAAGEGVMAALPFLAFLSDERTKENKRVVGELYNGEKVIAYNHPGMPTQIGVGAQHVERHNPKAVMEDHNGVKYVDYDRATRYAGGLVPRHGYATDGSVPAPNYDDMIRKAAEAEGVPYQIARQIAYNESRMQPGAKAETSTAGGLYGITDPTLKSLGGDPALKYDPEHNITHGVKYVGQNYRALTNAEDPDAAAKTYLGHFFGTGGAGNVLSDPNAPIAETLPNYGAAVKANSSIKSPSGKPIADWTGADALEWARAKMSGQGGGGIGGGRQVAAAQTTAPAEGGKGGLGDYLTSSRFLVPLGTGLLTMASSPSRYLGAAALQGLGAGLAATQLGEEGAQRIEKQRLENVGIGLGLVGKSITLINGIPHIMVPGQSGPVSYTDWVKMGRPMPVGGAAAANQFEAAGKQWSQTGGAGGAGAGAAPADAGKVDIGAPGVPTPQEQLEKPMQFGMTANIAVPKPASVSAEREETNLLNMTPDARKRQEELNQAIINQSVAKRNEAFAMTDNLNNLAVPLASMSSGERITPGALADVQAFITKYFDAVVDRAGLPPEYRLGGQGLSDYEMAQKAAALLRETKVQALGERAVSALQAVSQGIANPQMTAGAARGILATAIMEKQKAAEEAIFTQKYAEGRAVPVGQNASTEFRKYYKDEMYNKQAEAIKDLLSQNVNGVPLIAYLLPKGEGKDPKLKDRITADVINKKYGFDISRYFLNTVN